MQDKLGILTADTTPYYVSFFDLAATGPFVLEMPPGLTSGVTNDAWQRPIGDMGTPGRDQGRVATYLFTGQGQDAADHASDYIVVGSPTFNMLFGFRVLDPDPARAKAIIDRLRLYPLSRRDYRAPARVVEPAGKPYRAVQPRGLDYWERLADILDREVVEERDRFFHAMLRPVGIQKGMPFAPDARQRQILSEAALLGEAMARVNTFDKGRVGEAYWTDRHWHNVVVVDLSQRADHYEELDERAAFFYEVVTNSEAYVSTTPGVGQAYLGAYRDADGQWLDGGRTYRLGVPADPPAKLFWSVTVYDADTRCISANDQQIADRSSRMDLVRNADGSVDIYFGPTAPAGFEPNWIPTAQGRNWFTYFRFYGPTESYFDKSWQLPDIQPLT